MSYHIVPKPLKTDERTAAPVYALTRDCPRVLPPMVHGAAAIVFAATVSKEASQESFWFTTNVLGQTLQSASDNGLKYYVVDRANPLAKKHVEPADLIDKFKPFGSYARVARERGLSFGRLARMINAEQMLGVDLFECDGVDAQPSSAVRTPCTADAEAFVRVCREDPRYFELSNGKPFIPIGLNICWPRFESDPARALAELQRRFDKLSAGGGNFIRIWMSHPFYDVEHQRSGRYDAKKLDRIKKVLAMARERGIRVKLCIEHFRTLEDRPVKFPGSVTFGNPLHHVDRGGPAATMTEFFQAEKSRSQFKRKLHWLAEQIGDDPTVFAWELWNEINATHGQGWVPWTEEMLAELHAAFKNNMAVQNLGSLDRKSSLAFYRRVVELPGNDFAQVHRYLDMGAAWDVCHGPMDVLAADAVRQLAAFKPGKPVLLAECGAVEPRHSGPFKLYEKDRQGVLLHDLIFAPFFAGSAGCGQSWHWHFYVDKQDLWHHFGRFAEAVKGIDPRREAFSPRLIDHPRLRVYTLKGKQTTLIWCRDKLSDWQAELAQARPAQPISGAVLSLADLAPGGVQHAEVYDPWSDKRSTLATKVGSLALPRFTRSIVVRLRRAKTQ